MGSGLVILDYISHNNHYQYFLQERAIDHRLQAARMCLAGAASTATAYRPAQVHPRSVLCTTTY